MRNYLWEALRMVGWDDKYTVKVMDNTSRGDPDGNSWHEYLITPRKKKARKIRESQDFTREGTPLEKMNIGNEDFRMIQKMDQMAKGFRFKKVDSPTTDYDLEEGYKILQKWEDYKGQWIVLEKQLDDRHTLKYWASWRWKPRKGGYIGGKDTGLASPFLKKERWEEAFGLPD
jgi:hypothetical protein